MAWKSQELMEKSRDINYWHSTEDLSAHRKIQVRLVVTLYQSKGDQEFQGQGMNFSSQFAD